jgi:probable rRNA maturation factor
MEPPSSLPGGDLPLAVLVPERRWRRLVPGAERVVRRAAQVAGGVDGGAVVLEGDLAVRRLNARHRGRNKATNVLTFEPAPGSAGGDIVLAYGVVRREAREARRPASHHLAHLVVHAVLHLDGFEHATAGAARRMEQAEARLLSRIGVPNPWKPRP